MELNDYDIDEEIDEIDEFEARPRKKAVNKEQTSSKGGVKKGLLTALLVTAICILIVLLLLLGCAAYTYFTGQIVFTTKPEEQQGEKPIYTETQMQEILAEANEDAEALMNSQIAAAEEEGYQLGRMDLLNYIKETLLTNNSSLETFRLLYPDYFLVVSKGAYHFMPIDRTLKLSIVEDEYIKVLNNGEIQYVDENGAVSSHKGIDVSAFQGKIDWDKVAADGVDFAFVRVLYRGYESGKLVTDDRAEDNLKGAIDSGIHVGAYVFSQAINTEEAIEEANEAIEIVSKYASGVPIVIDVERVAGKNPRMDKLSVDERTDVILAFCDTVEKAGYKPIVYFNTEMALYIDNARINDITKWYAWYGTTKYYPYEYTIWQYKDSGKVNGISGNVDMNIALRPFWE